MTRTQLIRFDHLLGAKRAELLRSLHELRGRLVADRHGDAMDRSRRAADRAIVLQGIDLESELLRRVEGAIQEIRDRTFGICADCDRLIPVQRLEAVPWSPYCVSCQESAEAMETDGAIAAREGAYAHAG